VSLLLQRLEQFLTVAIYSDTEAKEWPEEHLIGENKVMTWGGGTFCPSSLLLLLPHL